jgi:hypothetical protein
LKATRLRCGPRLSFARKTLDIRAAEQSCSARRDNGDGQSLASRRLAHGRRRAADDARDVGAFKKIVVQLEKKTAAAKAAPLARD